MGHKIRPWSLLILALVFAACGRVDGDATSVETQTTTAATTADSDTSTDDSAPISVPRPPVGSYRQRYLSNFAPLIVHCMTELGWEATFDHRLGVVLPAIPLSQQIERDGAMSLCVAGSHSHRGIYAD